MGIFNVIKNVFAFAKNLNRVSNDVADESVDASTNRKMSDEEWLEMKNGRINQEVYEQVKDCFFQFAVDIPGFAELSDVKKEIVYYNITIQIDGDEAPDLDFITFIIKSILWEYGGIAIEDACSHRMGEYYYYNYCDGSNKLENNNKSDN